MKFSPFLFYNIILQLNKLLVNKKLLKIIKSFFIFPLIILIIPNKKGVLK